MVEIDESFEELTLRDYFAAKAMGGFLGSSRLASDVTDPKLAEAAYKIADAMMKARTKNG